MSILQAFNFNIFIHLQNAIYESSNFNKNIHYCTTALMEKEVFFGGNVFKFLSFFFSICSNWCWLNCSCCTDNCTVYTAQNLKHHDTGFSYTVYSDRYLELGTRIHAMTTRQPLQAKNEKIISPWCQDGVATFIYI